MEIKPVLGRGLSALIPEKDKTKKATGSTSLPIEQVKRSAYQPRINFNQEAHKELVDSIRKQGVIQPVIVRPSNGEYELIAGERRLRAAQDAGLTTIPVIIREVVSNKEAMEIAIIENVLREDLDPIEVAKGYNRLIKEFGLTQDSIAEDVGKERSSIANALRLLRLPENIKELISQNLISVGHAKVLLGVADEAQLETICKQIVNKSLSVRETERLIERYRTKPVHKRLRVKKEPQLSFIEDELKRKLGTSVTIWQGAKTGKIIIEYYSKDDLERIIDLLKI
jgi:ParB family chromosome partitioning protein